MKKLLIFFVVFFALVGLVAYNPFRRLAMKNNSTRERDVKAIGNALVSYMKEHKKTYPPEFNGNEAFIGTGNKKVNLCISLVPAYLSDIPIDPSSGVKTPDYKTCNNEGVMYESGYRVRFDETRNQIVVQAPHAQLSETIEYRIATP